MRSFRLLFRKSATTWVLFIFLLFRLLLALCAEEEQPLLHGLCQALPHFLPAEQLGLHLTWEHLPLSASPGGTLLRCVCCEALRLNRFPFWNTFETNTQTKNVTVSALTMGGPSTRHCRRAVLSTHGPLLHQRPRWRQRDPACAHSQEEADHQLEGHQQVWRILLVTKCNFLSANSFIKNDCKHRMHPRLPKNRLKN